MQVDTNVLIQEQLLDRRKRLERAREGAERDADLERLLAEVDAALGRVERGTFGLCEECHEPIERDRLIADPLVRFCLDHLSALERQALQEDLTLAARIQRELLPKGSLAGDGWEVAYHYRPAGPVSGDYCDVARSGAGDLYFLLGDVSGKGVAASLLMSHLHAMLRTLISIDLPLEKVLEHANRLFCESTLPTQYATLVGVRACRDGTLEVANAGHPPALWRHADRVDRIDATGLPVGMFGQGRFSVSRLQPAPGDVLLLYSDGAIEAEDRAGASFGVDGLATILQRCTDLAPGALVTSCLAGIEAFLDGGASRDDLTLMAIRRAAA